MLFFFSLLLDINFCFELVKVKKNLQQNFEALFHIWKACWTDDFVRSIRQNLAVKTRGTKYIYIKNLFWISKSKEKSSAKLQGPLPHLEGMLDRWFCEVNTSKSRRKNQRNKIYQESYWKLILVCTTNINLKEEGFFSLVIDVLT